MRARMSGKQLGVTWITCILGGGFVSGQEISQFFNHFGRVGFFAQIAAVIGLCLMVGCVLTVAHRTRKVDLSQVSVPVDRPILHELASIIAVTHMYGIYVVMCAGAGTMLEQITGSHALRIVFSALFVTGVTFVTIRGVDSAVKVFGKINPILVTLSFLVVFSCLFTFGGDCLNFQPTPTENPVVNQWTVAMLVFISYTLLCAIGTLAPMGPMTKSPRDIWVGVALGGAILMVMSLGIHMSMAARPESMLTELPMLYLAGEIHPALELAYGLVICLGMFGAGISVFMPCPHYVLHFKPLQNSRIAVPVVLSVLAFFLSQLGFSKLIGTVYPIYGFLGFAFILGILLNVKKTRRPAEIGGTHDPHQ